MPVTITPVSEGFSVAPQLTAEDFAEVARLGFRSVINNRPDFEGGPSQPTGEQLRDVAASAGLQYVHLPSAPTADNPDVIASMRELLQQLPQPVLAFCRTGTRSAKLYRAANAA